MKKKREVPLENKDLIGTGVDLPSLLEFAYEQGVFDVVPNQAGTSRAHALQSTQGQTQIQLDMLLEQMKLIATQAQEIKERVALSQRIHEAQMSFEPVVGSVYYLYLKSEGDPFLSLIAPSEWKTHHQWLAEVKLAADHTWEIRSKAQEFDRWSPK